MSVHCRQGHRSPSRGGPAYGAGVAHVDVQHRPRAVSCAWLGSRVPCAPAPHRATCTKPNAGRAGPSFAPPPGAMPLAAPVTSRRVPFRWQLLRPRRRESGQAHCAGPYRPHSHTRARSGEDRPSGARALLCSFISKSWFYINVIHEDEYVSETSTLGVPENNN